jgi:hypothetical protein
MLRRSPSACATTCASTLPNGDHPTLERFLDALAAALEGLRSLLRQPRRALPGISYLEDPRRGAFASLRWAELLASAAIASAWRRARFALLKPSFSSIAAASGLIQGPCEVIWLGAGPGRCRQDSKAFEFCALTCGADDGADGANRTRMTSLEGNGRGAAHQRLRRWTAFFAVRE